MKHAVLLKEVIDSEKVIAFKTSDGIEMYLKEQEYSQEELDIFQAEKEKWILKYSGKMNFVADNDNGEDAEGSFLAHFDPEPRTAVFEDGALVGFYLVPGGIMYSGNGRASFEIDSWGYPGYDPFDYLPTWKTLHVFLFAEAASLSFENYRSVWELIKREPDKKYSSGIGF